MPELDINALVAFVAATMHTPSPVSTDPAIGDRVDFPDGFKPPNGRALLTSYCTLLL